jgi:alpha-tubulin suppressor-like RCC1 family protein
MGAALPAVDLGPGAIVKSVVAGFHHTCALLDSGQVKCWGMNAYGEAGVGDKSNHGTMPGHMGTALPFVDLGPGQKATALYAGMGTSCAVLESGPIKCWGRNHVGQLGLGDTQDRGDQPGEMGAALPAVNLGPGAKVVALAMGREHTCALLDDHTVKCWGGNTHGQLGQGDTNARGAVPTDMGSNLPVVDLGPGLQPVALSVSAIAFHTCALFPNGAFKCWGLNMHGQLGIGAGPDKRGDAPGEMGTNLPFVNVGTGAQTAALAAGALHSCAVLQTGAVKCWGNNSEGQCGVGDTVFRGMLPSSMGDALPAADLGM